MKVAKITIVAFVFALSSCDGSSGDDGSGGAATSGGSGAGGTGTGGVTTGGAGAGGRVLPPWESCPAPSTKCKGRCFTLDAPDPECPILAGDSFDRIELVGDALYLQDYDDVLRMAKTGGELTPVLAEDTAAFFHVSGEYIYWAWEFAPDGPDGPLAVGGYVARRLLAGGSAEYLVDELEGVRAIHVVGDTLFMGDCPTVLAGAVYRTGPLGQVSTADPATLLVQSADAVCDIATDNAFVYAGIESESQIGQIVKMPLEGGSPTVLHEGGMDESYEFLLSGANLYWLSFSNRLSAFPPPGTLGVIDLGTGTNTVLAETDGFSGNPTTDGRFVYLASSTLVWRVPVTGGTPERVLSTESGQIADYVLDGDSFIIALSEQDGHTGALIRTSTIPEVLPTE